MLNAARLSNPSSQFPPGYPLLPNAMMASQMLQMASVRASASSADPSIAHLGQTSPIISSAVVKDESSRTSDSPKPTPDVDEDDDSEPKVTDSDED